MPPTRTELSSKRERQDTEEGRRKKRKGNRIHQGGSSATPGLQKIKSSIRQTRRLLAKDNLTPDVRVSTERRLKSLEMDLENAQRTKTEQNFAKQYHMVKFFDRQKTIRKIKQTLRELEDTSLSKPERKKLEKSLLALRVDLNYIIHYPKLQRYIALHPTSGESAPETNEKREVLRSEIRQRMKDGELSAIPEIGLGAHDRRNKRTGEASKPRPPETTENKLKESKNKYISEEQAKSSALPSLKDDEFFGGDESDENDE